MRIVVVSLLLVCVMCVAGDVIAAVLHWKWAQDPWGEQAPATGKSAVGKQPSYQVT